MSIKVGIVIVNYQNAKDTIICVESLKNQTIQDFKVYVVDNASPDGSGETIREYYENHPEMMPGKGIDTILSSKNGGFSAGNNMGARQALANGVEYLLFLNNDTVAAPNMLECLLGAATENMAVAPEIYYYVEPQRVWYAGGRFDKFGTPRHIGINKMDDGEYNTEKKVTFLTGCCFLLSASLFLKVGFWGEDFFLYCEDAEYSLRLTKCGAQMLYLPAAKLWHKIGNSTGGGETAIGYFYGSRNRFAILREYHYPLYCHIFAVLSILHCWLKYCFKQAKTYRYAPDALAAAIKRETGMHEFSRK